LSAPPAIGPLLNDAADRFAPHVDRDRPELAGYLKPLWEDVADDDLAGAALASRDRRGQPDGARAHDDDRVGGPHRGEVAAVDADRDRLAERALLITRRVRQSVSEVCTNDGVLRHPAINGRRGVKNHFWAEVVTTGLAHRTATTGHAWFDRYARSDGQLFDSRSNRDHVTGQLVADDHRRLDDVLADSTVNVIVDVRGADATGTNPDEGVIRPYRRNGNVLDSQVADSVEDCSLHGCGKGRHGSPERLNRSSLTCTLRQG
jgi:hypothetical protein